MGSSGLEEVKADAPTVARWNGERLQQAGRRQVVCLDAPTRRAGAHVLLHSRRQVGPPHQAARQGSAHPAKWDAARAVPVSEACRARKGGHRAG